MKRKERIISVILSIAICLSLFAGISFDSMAYDQSEINDALKLIYENQKVRLQYINVKKDSTDGALIKDEGLSFTIFDSTIQEFLSKDLKAHNGVLDPIDVIKGHHYIIWMNPNPKYHMKKFGYNGSTKRYITLDQDVAEAFPGEIAQSTLPKNDKSRMNNNAPDRTIMCCLVLENGATTETTERIPIGLSDVSRSGLPAIDMDDYMIRPSELKIKLVNQYEEIDCKGDSSNDNYLANVIEDLNYAVVAKDNSSGYKVLSNLITTKDHSEQKDTMGNPVKTRTYTHYTCNSVSAFYVTNNANEYKKYKYAPLVSESRNSSLDGVVALIDGNVKINQGNNHDRQREFLFYERKLSGVEVPSLKGKDYEVYDFDTINMHRWEISKLPYGDYTITTKLPSGKSVDKVYNIKDNGKLEECSIVSIENGNVSFKTSSVACYNTAIVYKKEVDVKGITCPSSVKVKPGSTKKLSVSFDPADANMNTKLTFTSANKSIATVGSDGTIKGIKPGKTQITVSNSTGIKKTVSVTVEPYSIKYELKGGKNNTANKSSYDGSSKITLSAPTKTGYTFDGWYTSSKYTGKKVTSIQKGASGNKTFYAKWIANKYKIAFDKNNGTGTTMKSISATYDKSKSLPKVTYKRKGYTFVGWNTKPNAKGKEYANKASVKNLTSKSDATAKLYAHWVNNNKQYGISYELNGGKKVANPTKYTVVTKTIKLKAPTRKGYTFSGWYKNSKFTGKKVTSIKKGSYGNVKLYAKWEKK